MGPSAGSSRVVFPIVDAMQFCMLDLSGIATDTDALVAIEESKSLIAQWPAKSLRVLTDVSGARMSLSVISALTDLAKHNEPYVTRSAITGLALVHRVALRQVTRVTGREIREFRTRAEAMAWLTVP